jgi:hypothetical protein
MIPEGAPIYMRHDSSYCSTGCREKGVSSLFTTLVNQQLRMLSERGGRHASLDGRDTSFGAGLNSIKSDSSIHSRYSTVSDSTVKTGSDIQEASLPVRLVGYLGNKLLETIIPPVQRNPVGDTLLRTYSSGLMWGKEYTRNSSFNAIFRLMPEIDIYLPASDSETPITMTPPGTTQHHMGPNGRLHQAQLQALEDA